MAGEASADVHGANLVRAMLARDPALRFGGIGGPRMAEAGVRILVSSSEMAVVGLTEVLSRAALVLDAARCIKKLLRAGAADLLILIDYPGFNLHIARTAKQCRIPVLYYITPQVWAWRQGRVRKIARRVDRLAVILPFEEAFYAKHGLAAEYVGHPLMDACPRFLQAPEARQRLGLGVAEPVLALLPGSRVEEVGRLLPVMVAAAERVWEHFPGLQAVVPVAEGLDTEWVKSLFGPGRVRPKIFRGRVHEVLAAAEAAVVTSGTATLEAAIAGVPMVTVYKVSRLTYHIGKRLIKVPFISLVNLVAGQAVIRELIQDDVSPERVADAVLPLLGDGQARARMIADLGRVRDSLGRGGASERTAAMALEMLKGRTQGRQAALARSQGEARIDA